MADNADFPLPPANFSFLVESILMQTQMQLGLLHFGEQGEEPEPNLPLARHSIDLLAVLQEKTRGNLTVEEQRILENGLTELRFRFVQVSEELKGRAQPGEVTGRYRRKDTGKERGRPSAHHYWRRRERLKNRLNARTVRACVHSRARFRNQRGRAHDWLPVQSLHLERSSR